MAGQVHLERDGDIAVLVIDNPPVNAGSHDIRKGLLAAIAEVEADDRVCGAVLIGAGGSFISGSDIREFDLPLGPQVSDFQKKFGAALCAIRFGETRTYGELAREMGVPAQAIGQACGANPIPVILPCHRVVAANGGAGGFSGKGGLKTKSALLDIESPDLRLF